MATGFQPQPISFLRHLRRLLKAKASSKTFTDFSAKGRDRDGGAARSFGRTPSAATPASQADTEVTQAEVPEAEVPEIFGFSLRLR